MKRSTKKLIEQLISLIVIATGGFFIVLGVSNLLDTVIPHNDYAYIIIGIVMTLIGGYIVRKI